MVLPKGHVCQSGRERMKLLKDWFPAMVRRLSITLTDMTSNFCLCVSGSQGRSEDLPVPHPALLLHAVPHPHQSADQGEEHQFKKDMHSSLGILFLCLLKLSPTLF